MITPGSNDYAVILAEKYYLRELIERAILEESLDEIACRCTVTLVVTPEFPGIAPGQLIRVSGVPFGGTSMTHLLNPGVVWDTDSAKRGLKHLTATIYDPTIYMARSEDEYLFPAGQTADQRIKKYALDWNIPVATLPTTGMQLSKAVYRAQPIYNMMLADLRETVSKGGKMYRPRMTPAGLELFELGTNQTVWVLEEDQNLEEVGQRRTLEGAVTQVKVLGAAPDEGRSPVLAFEKGDTANLGTLQRVIQDAKVTTTGAAKKAAQEMLSGAQETITVSGIDINTIRAGDQVRYNGQDLLATSVRHELGSPGHMQLELGTQAYVRRNFYNARPV